MNISFISQYHRMKEASAFLKSTHHFVILYSYGQHAMIQNSEIIFYPRRRSRGHTTNGTKCTFVCIIPYITALKMAQVVTYNQNHIHGLLTLKCAFNKHNYSALGGLSRHTFKRLNLKYKLRSVYRKIFFG